MLNTCQQFITCFQGIIRFQICPVDTPDMRTDGRYGRHQPGTKFSFFPLEWYHNVIIAHRSGCPIAARWQLMGTNSSFTSHSYPIFHTKIDGVVIKDTSIVLCSYLCRMKWSNNKWRLRHNKNSNAWRFIQSFWECEV